MKKIILILSFFILLFPIIVSADFGPKLPNEQKELMERIERKSETQQIIKDYDKKEHPIKYLFKYNIIAFMPVGFCLFALIITQIIELLVAEVIILFTKISRKILLAIFITNCITVPFLFIIVLIFQILAGLTMNLDHITDTFLYYNKIFIFLMEFLIIIFEGYFIHLLMKKIFKKQIPIIFSYFLSTAINIATGIPYLIFLMGIQ